MPMANAASADADVFDTVVILSTNMEVMSTTISKQERFYQQLRKITHTSAKVGLLLAAEVSHTC